MTARRRMFFNVLATYGRSLIAMMCGIFTSRWVLAGLGVKSYGVNGVISVVIACVMFFNTMLSSSVSRFFAYTVGETSVAKDQCEALARSREWFNVALFVHTVLPVVLVAIGLPSGLWAIRNYFSIPVELKDTACWVLVFSLIAAFVSMVGAPFRALFLAKQLIAELTAFDLLATVANFCFAYSLLHFNGNRLLYHGFYSMIVIAVPLVLIAWRAFVTFPECRVDVHKMMNAGKLRELFAFAGWQLFSWTGGLIRSQGVTTMVNKMLGVEYNSTMNVASTVSGHASSLAGALQGAFAPAITNAAGAGDEEKMLRLTLQTCKFGSALTVLFVIPLLIEIHYVIHLWLTVVPPQVESLCVVTLISLIFSRTTGGVCGALFAIGRIREHEVLNGLLLVMTIVYAWILCGIFDYGIVGFGWALLFGNGSTEFMRLILWRVILKRSLRPWIKEFFLPLTLVTIVSYVIGVMPTVLLSESFSRLLIVAVLFVGSFSFGCTRFLLNREERAVVLFKFKNMMRAAHGK